MIRINLLPIREAQRALGRRQQLSVGILSVAVAILVMIVPYLIQGRRMARLDGEIEQLRSEIQKYNDQAKEVRDLDKKRTDLQAKLKVIADLKQKRVGPVRILADLSTATPEKLWLVDFSDINSQATIAGMALDNQTIATFMRQLQGSKYFFDVDLVETAQSEPIRGVLAGDSGIMFKKFIIKAHLDYLGMGGKLPPGSEVAAAKKTGT